MVAINGNRITESEIDFCSLTVVIPTLNEAGTIGPLLDELLKRYPGIHVIVADDDSTDNTRDEVSRRAQTHPQVSVLWRKNKTFGLTAAVLDALDSVSTEYFVVMDGDLQHPPSVLNHLMLELGAGYPVAVATSIRQELSPIRYLISRAGTLMGGFRLKLGGSAVSSDCMSGYFGGHTALFTEVLRKPDSSFELQGYKVLFDFLKQFPSDTRVAEVSYQFGRRSSGESKISLKIMGMYLRSLLR